MLDDFNAIIQSFEKDKGVLKKVVLMQETLSSSQTLSKIHVPEPKGFNSNQNAKKLENFLWDIKRYFKIAWILETEMVTIISMQLTSDAKLWWQTRDKNNTELGRPQIIT